MTEDQKSQMFTDEERLEHAIQCLKVLAHPLRLKILILLMDGPMNVSSLERAVQSSQPNISQHLAIMRYRGMLQQDKRGNEVFYSIRNDRLKRMLNNIAELFCEEVTE